MATPPRYRRRWEEDNMDTSASSWPRSFTTPWLTRSTKFLPILESLQLMWQERRQAIQQTDFLEHKEERRIYINHNMMEDALKSIIIDTVDEVYISKLWNKYTSYLGITARDLLDHLLDWYGKITTADVEECKKQMNEPIDAMQPIHIYFKSINNTVEYAANGNVTFTTE